MEFFKTKIIELFGLPKTGKTTSALALKDYLEREGKKVSIVKERATICPVEDKLHPSFNYWTTISFIKEYIEANNKSVDILIVDRGILDSYVWVNMLSKRINNYKYFEAFEKMASQEIIINNYLLALYFSASIEAILQRDQESQINKSFGRIINKEILNNYVDSYLELETKLRQISQIKKIDSNINGIKDVLTQVSVAVADILVQY